jgi:guanine deaminase
MVVQGLNADGSNSPDASRLVGRAIELAVENVKRGGGPFGALVVRDGKIIGEGANCVTRECDPTAHAEVVAIRAACKHEQQFHLDGCVLYTSCEPCPMCLAAAYWARVSKIYYAATAETAASAGFADAFIYEQFRLPHEQRSIAMVQVPHVDAARAFQDWGKQPEKIDY